ncbi:MULTISPECIES: YveK family protein [Coprobacillaceae]|uniref:YveK family protein n=1 Tax=Coprobacillaceae TaxID=2810280 RepID=UPI000E48AD3B|nr:MULTISPECIES: Wzz/FepE/Etk N-terminal domain-containing protein [Coprobacillaceae]RHM62818.1 hypothetical protein DWZ53_01990 [Coprobacillus sp. AF33-1AC]RHS96115.1 hypothetical protein DW911_01930 [Erysipelatoclostridium sp. AM42-17]
MTENQEIQNEDIEINLGELFEVLKSHLHIIIISTLVCAILVGVFTIFFVEKKYSSSARIFPKPQVNEGVVDYSQITSNNLMTNNYVALLNGNSIQSKVAQELKVDTGVVSSALAVSNESDTQIISISATTNDPQLSKKIVDTTVSVFTQEVKDTLNINNITTVDEAKLQTTPVSPSLTKNLVIGGLVGLIVSIGIIFIRFMLDNRIHTKEDAENYLGIPNLGVIPYFEDK